MGIRKEHDMKAVHQHKNTVKQTGIFCSFLTQFVLLFGTSCQMFQGEEQELEQVKDDRFGFLDKQSDDRKTGPVSMQEEQVNAGAIITPDISKEQLDLLEKATESSKKSFADKDDISPFYADFILLDSDEKLSVAIAFNSAPLQDVIPAFADILGFNYIADPDLKGVVSININSEMTKQELWHIFDKMLNLAGAGVLADKTLFRILPLSKLAQQPDIRMPQDFDSEVLYVVLKNAIAKDVIAQIKPFLGIGSVCVELTKPNAVLISDERSNIPKLKQLLEIVDMNGYEQWPRAVMVCNNIIPSQVVEELRKVLPVLGFYVQASDNKTGTAANRNTATQPGAIQLSAIDRLQLIVASAATEEAIAEIRQWVEILDNANSLDEERVFVYKVRHGKADQLAKALAVIYNLSGQSLTIDTETGNNKVENISASSGNTTTVRRTTNNNNQNQTTNTDAGQAGSIFENTVKLFADGVLNRLVIRTTPRTYASMKAVLDRLDIVPAQVLLQVLLVEVTLTEATKFGVEFSATGEWMGDNMVLGNTYDNLNPDLTGGGVRKEGGATILLTDPSNPQNKFAYLKALAGNNLLEIVASPQLLVSSHNQAVINVGAKVPITSQSLTSSDSSNIVQNVEYEDTGAILTVTPQITSTDLIGLELKQELSEAVVNTVSNIDSPQITTRTLETTMTIKNGATMIIGGMIQKKKKDDLAGLPLVNNIPLLRRLFGSTDSSVERTELLVLITGYIVDEKSDVEEMINRYDEAVKALNEFCSDLGDSQEKNKSAAVKNNSVAGNGK